MFLKTAFLWVYRFFIWLIYSCYDWIEFGPNVDFVNSSLGLYKDKAEHYVGYEQSNVISCRDLETFIRKNKQEVDSVLDVGCGKGRMLYFFYQLGFDRSDGVEFSKELSNVAKRNYDLIKSRKKIQGDLFQVFNCDATDFSEYGNYNWFYFYNPFDALIMEKVLKLILDSRGNGQTAYIIYKNPLNKDTIINLGGRLVLTCQDSFLNRKLRQEIYIYELG